MLLKSLGLRLRLFREAQSMSQKKVADVLGNAESHIYAIEAGTAKPSLSLLEDFSRIYRVDEADLLTFPGEGIKHGLRDEIRKLPSSQSKKLQDLVEVLKAIFNFDDSQMEKLKDYAVSLGQPATRKTRRAK